MLNKSVRRIVGVGLLCLLALSFGSLAARAGLTFTVDILRWSQGNYYRFYTPLETNSTPPDAPLGTYFISSPFYSLLQPTNGSWRQIEVSTNGVFTIAGVENPYTDFNSVMQQITNGTWSILFTNATTTNLYTFTVSAPTMTSNMLPATIITFPSDGALNVPNQPNFTWQGPSSWPVNGDGYVYDYYADNYGYRFFEYASLPAAQNNWTIPARIPNGMNCTFQINFLTNNTTPIFVATTPLNTNAPHAAISGWVSTSTLETGDNVTFAVTNPPAAGISLVAHYTFDNSGNLGQDTSGHGYDLNYNGGSGVTSSGTAAAGSGAANFNGGSFFSYTSTPSNVLSALVGDFTLSFWIKTSQNNGNQNGPAYAGAGILTADVPGSQYYDLVPAALDGGQIGFNTGHYDDTINSVTDVNNGNYHHVAITRNQTTGEKQIYIDGALNNSQFATVNPLSDPRLVAIGCQIDASQSNPNTANTADYFNGLLDDIQIYSGVLSSSAIAQLHSNPGSTAAVSGGGHTLVAHYPFDNSGNIGQDTSGKGNDMGTLTTWGPEHQFNSDAKAGGGAVKFFGTSSMNPLDQVLTNLNAVLAGSFSFSTWVKTSISNGVDNNDAFYGAVIFWAYNDQGNTNDTIPLAITGSKAAFFTRDHVGDGTTLHSGTTINDGNYHLITTTRDAATGLKVIYVDGNYETSEVGTTDRLNGNNYYFSIGGYAYCTDGNCTNFYSYNGLLDDVQIYSGVLSASEVAALHNTPGSTAPDVAGNGVSLGDALNAPQLAWTTTGDAAWFGETNNTYDNVSAAQSGIVTNFQTTTLQTTVTGPGTITFWWQNPTFNNLDLEFDLDGNYQYDIGSGSTDWAQFGPSPIPPGPHTLSWTVFAKGDNDPTQAAYLDEVTFIPDTAPVITLNPFDQTNYPGYSVALLAAATSNAAITWQWFKVGNASPIPNATNALFIPTNSGTAGVVGNYYGVASNLVGSANTTTASVSFVSAPLPPDWSHALKSPFAAVDASTFTKDYYLGCAVDAAGDIYAAAQYNGNMNVLTNGNVENILTAPGSSGAALVKHAANGNPIWAVGLTNNQSAGYSYGKAVATAPGNGAYLASTLVGTNWLGTNKFVDAGGSSILLSRFDANGSNVWSRLIGGTNYVYTTYNMMVSDVSGNVTLIGNMSGTVNFGGTNLAAPSGAGFMVQYDANGAVRWAQTIPDYAYSLAYGSALLYVSLQSSAASGVTNISIGSLSNVTDRAWAVACLNAANGQALWLRGVGDQYGAHHGSIDDAPQISVSGSDVFLTGNAYGSSAVFGGLSVSLPGGRGQYFARYDTNGNPQVAAGFGSPTTTLWASTANASGVYVSGDFDSYSHFGSKLIAAPVYAQNDLGPDYYTQPFVAKFDRNGNALWARNGVSSDLANFRGIATTSDGVWACGFLKITNSIPAQFGTNFVYSDLQIVGSPIGILTWHQAGMIAKITDSAAVALPVALLNPHDNGTNFQFSFMSQSGFTHAVQYRTNLVAGSNWQTYSNVTGDGALKTIPIPLSVFNPSKQGFVRVSTQ